MIWRALQLAVWFGVAFALCTVVVAAALVAVLGAVVFGLASPSRTPRSTLRMLARNASDGIARVLTLRPG